MFELIRVLVEAIAKAFSPKVILDARKNRQLNEIGTELFLAYTRINDILVVGRQIVRELESGLSWMRRKIDEGNPDQCYSIRIQFLLNQQSVNILKLESSIYSLRYELELMSPEVIAMLAPVQDGSECAIRHLVKALSGEKPYLIAIDADKLPGFWDRWNNAVDSEPGCVPGYGPYSDELLEMMVRVEIEDISYIPASSHDVIEAYLETQRARQVNGEIESIAKKLHESIGENFSLNDVLLGVADARLEL